mgnify:CR=1 FL=1
MREAVLNSACFAPGFANLVEATEFTADLERGFVTLVNAGHLVQQLRMHATSSEVTVAPGVSLHDVFRELCRKGPDTGRFLMRLLTKYPIDDGVTDEELAALLELDIAGHPGCYALLLCWHSRDRVCATLSPDPLWRVSPLEITAHKFGEPEVDRVARPLRNFFSLESAKALLAEFNDELFSTIEPPDLWERRAELFPNLDFAPSVEGDLAALSEPVFRQALFRLKELCTASNEWRTSGSPVPKYLTKVTGESLRTMQQFGQDRIFRSSFGNNEVFELHARLQDGHRLHLREIPLTKRLEVGYIGKHLRVVSEK